MRSADIRQRFIEYFQERGHQRVPSSPLVPAQDPTLLFTNAGMVQFKDVFIGVEERPYHRAVSVQKCMRAGGKHNDLDQVGKTARHQTFFEMLGNFSFGDYFKAEAIRLAWGFLTEEMKISPDVLWVTVFETDDEAFQLWQEIAHVSPDRIVRMGEKDNFWAMGDTGPCGPSSEIFVDRGQALACGPDCGLGRCECDRIQEIWNLVFMQYNRSLDGTLTPLPKPSIDTGMGLERIAAYLQGVDSNFETDLLKPLIDEVASLSKHPYDAGAKGMPHRVIADHIRSIVFLLAEGVSFSNSDRGYVMRRILRRAVRYGMLLGFDGTFLWRLVPTVGQIMGGAYPEVIEGQSLIQDYIREEEERFAMTLNTGMKVLNDKMAVLSPGATLSGQDAFLLADTYGFPLDLTLDAAEERGILVDQVGFEHAMEEQRERARRGRLKPGQSLPSMGTAHFEGYSHLNWEQEPIRAIYIGEDRVGRLVTGETGWVWLARTPFYPEGGGQVADTGWLTASTGSARVLEVTKSGHDIWHLVEVVEGYIESGQPVDLAVDKDARWGAMRNHTGTHLLHAALRRVLGEGVHQTGSYVSPDRLRFDFSYPRPLTPQQIAHIEDLVNQWILEDRPVDIAQMSRDDALDEGALAFFGDKYGDVVRVVSVPGASKELCGGTHCARTGEIGLFAVMEDISVGAGSRRLEAVTGLNALKSFRMQKELLENIQGVIRAPLESLTDRIMELSEALRQKESALEQLQRQQRESLGRDLAVSPWVLEGLRLLVAEVEVLSVEALRQVLDGAKPSLDGAILAARHGDRASFVVYLGRTLTDRGLNAQTLVRILAPIIQGGGGGKQDMAQAGGKDPNGVPLLLEEARRILTERLVVAGQG